MIEQEIQTKIKNAQEEIYIKLGQRFNLEN